MSKNIPRCVQVRAHQAHLAFDLDPLGDSRHLGPLAAHGVSGGRCDCAVLCDGQQPLVGLLVDEAQVEHGGEVVRVEGEGEVELSLQGWVK